MSGEARQTQTSRFRIDRVTLDESTVAKRNPEIEQEKSIAISDLLERNRFQPRGSPGGPYHLRISLQENRLVLDMRLKDDAEHGRVLLSLTPFKRLLKEYREICDSHYAAMREAPPARIEAIDMGRRALHDEGAQTLMERLKGKIAVDFATARGLFTLICALSLKG